MIKNIPVRLDYYQYCVETWEEILKSLDFKDIRVIIDLCLGWSPKLELALLKTNFNGTLIAIDKSKNNLNSFNSLLEPFPKKYKIEFGCFDILKNHQQLKTKHVHADLVLANHIIDDLILGLFLKKKDEEKNLFENMELMKEVWIKIFNNKKIIEKTYVEFKKVLLQLVNKNGHIIMAQYLGYQENLYGLEKVFKECRRITEKLKEDLIATGKFVDENNIINFSFSKLNNPYFQKKDIFCLKRVD